MRTRRTTRQETSAQGWALATMFAGALVLAGCTRTTTVRPDMRTALAMHEQGQQPKTDAFEPGFKATWSGDRLSVRDGDHASPYALSENRGVDAKHMRGSETGIMLMAISPAPVLAGVGFLGLSRAYVGSGDGATEGAGRMFTGVGAGLMVAGGALLLAGGVVLAASPAPPKVERPTPALEIGPGSARVRVAF